MSVYQLNEHSLRKAFSVIAGFIFIFLLALLAWTITKQVYAHELPYRIPGKTLEYPLWAVLTGLLGNVLLRLTGLRDRINRAVRTELFLKVGLVLLGAGINLTQIVHGMLGAVIQSLILVSSVFLFGWWVAGLFGLESRLRAVMSTALAVCGVSAAIAAGGAVLAKKEQVSYVTTLVILVALPMIIIMPLLANALNLPEAVAGAWFGGNIDTTAAVIGAGTVYGDIAQQMASIVKSTQNTLIGVVAFLLALFFASRDVENHQKPDARMIWDRFPKFVLGFILASVLYTVGVIDGGRGTAIDALKNWFFTLAFVCMGLELSLADFRLMGWKPVVVFLIVTIFNTLLALGVAYLIFGFWLPMS